MAAARATGVAVVVLLLAFLTLPSLVVIVVSFNPTALMAFPPHGLSLRWYQTSAVLDGMICQSSFALKFSSVVLSCAPPAVTRLIWSRP